MGKVKKQHFVPQFYLRKFHVPSEFKLINVFDKVNMQIRLNQPIEDVACERFFYDIDWLDAGIKELFLTNLKDIDINELNPQVIENYFSNAVESRLSPVLNNIFTKFTICNPKQLYSIPFFGIQERSHMALGITYQLLRTKEYQQINNQFVDTLICKLNHENLNGKSEEMLEFFQKTKGNKSVENFMLLRTLTNSQDLLKMMVALCNHIWIIGHNRTDIPFYTSDNPIVKHAHISNSYMSYGGIASKGIEIAYPLTPELILIMLEREYHKCLETYENNVMPLDDVEAIDYYNSLQMYQSYRQVFCNKDCFNFAKEYCKKYPQCTDINRPRIMLN